LSGVSSSMHTDPKDNWRLRIKCDPAICGGEPCIVGTQVPVSVIVATVADEGIDAVLKHFPQLTIDDVKAALYFAAQASHSTIVG